MTTEELLKECEEIARLTYTLGNHVKGHHDGRSIFWVFGKYPPVKVAECFEDLAVLNMLTASPHMAQLIAKLAEALTLKRNVLDICERDNARLTDALRKLETENAKLADKLEQSDKCESSVIEERDEAQDALAEIAGILGKDITNIYGYEQIIQDVSELADKIRELSK